MASKVPRLVGPKPFRQGFAVGVVVAKHHPKTIRVAVTRRLINRKYQYRFTRKTALKVHDEFNETALGDLVIIKQCKPRSKTKFYEVHDIAVRYPAVEFLEKNPEFKQAMDQIHKSPHKEDI